MLMVKVKNGTVDRYPYTLADLRADYPQTSFPADLSQADLSDFDVYKVTPTAKPEADYTQVVEEIEPMKVGENWAQVWIVRDATEEEETAAFNELAAQYESAVQAHLNFAARERGYDNILSACSYAAGDHPRFSVEGKDCIAWRSAVWEKAFLILSAVKNKVRPLPTIQEVISELPVIVWSI